MLMLPLSGSVTTVEAERVSDEGLPCTCLPFRYRGLGDCSSCSSVYAEPSRFGPDGFWGGSNTYRLIARTKLEACSDESAVQ